MTEKAKLEPRMVRFEPVVLMSRLKVKLRMRVRMNFRRARQCICNAVFHTQQVDDVACELTDVGELSLLTSRPGWSCSE